VAGMEGGGRSPATLYALNCNMLSVGDRSVRSSGKFVGVKWIWSQLSDIVW